jgi:uncharacterized repeat protein (TIGR03803 family)
MGGDLYGTAQFGGIFAKGVVFKLSLTGSETVLHSFTGKADGGQPVASLFRDGAAISTAPLRQKIVNAN